MINSYRQMVLILFILLALITHVIGDNKKLIVGDWAIKLTPKPNNTLEHTDKPYDDVLTFNNNKISSKVCKGFEFDSVTYASKVAAGKTEYLASMKSPKHGNAIWKFTITDKKIEGTFQWTSEGKSANFTFSGEQKVEDKK
jgi:hypothetical protein